MKNVLIFLFSMALPFFTAFAGSAVTTPSIRTWYAELNKPWFSPPNWVFGPVWTLLFVLMGIALFLVLRQGLQKEKNRVAFAMFVFQLVLNFLWSFLFFFLHQPLFAFLDIVALWISIIVTIKLFQKVSVFASRLLWPYLAWVSFASLLNLAIVLLN